MPYTKSFPELAERIGAGTADFADKLAETVRGFACNLWNNFPDQITQNRNLASSFARGVMTAACTPNNPPPPTEPFTGGQCDQIQYLIRVEFRPTPTDPFSLQTLGAGNPFFGPIQSLQLRFDSNFQPANDEAGFPEIDGTSPNRGDFRLFSVETNPTTGEPQERLTQFGFNTPGQTGTARFVEIVRLDGQPDNCGNPPPIYPPTNPTSNDYTTIITINNDDGTTVNFPLTYIPITNNFPLNFDLGGISISLDLGGVNFNFDGRRPNGDPEPLGDGQETPVPTPLDDLDRNFPAPRQPTPNPDDYEEEPRTPTDPKEETIGDDVAFVKVTLTQIPSNAKQQWGDGAPDVIYAGWFEFQAGGHYFPRQPIHFENSIFVPPRGVIGYAYTLYNGFNGFATIYKLKET